MTKKYFIALLEVEVAEGVTDVAKKITDHNQGHFIATESPEGLVGFLIVDAKVDEVKKVTIDQIKA